MAYGGQRPSPPALEVGSPVELVRDPMSRHGVIRWMGSLPGTRGTMAGVELDSPMEGSGDGTWMGHHYFTCRPGKAIFIPVASLRHAPRMPQPTLLPNSGRQAAISPDIALQVQQYQQSKGLSLEDAVREAGKEIVILQETGKNLGGGSYGGVIEVQVQGRKCAAKKLHEMFTGRDVPRRDRAAIAERFENECRRVIYLSHPNIVEMIGIHFDRATRLPTLVMELMDISLDQHLENNPKPSSVPLSTKYSILRDVASGLLYLHSLPPPLGPIIHRDLTAKNILLNLGSEVVAKIADLGQAKTDPVYATRQQMLSMNPGNQLYMPPEARVEDPVYNASLDVFSFGVVVLHTLTHEWPDPDKGHLEVDRRRLHLDKIASDPLKPLVTQCLSQEPRKRPTTSEVYHFVEQQYSAVKVKGRKREESREISQRKEHVYDTVGQFGGSQGHPDPPLVHVGSPVQLMGDPSRHGVIRWLGTLPEIQGAMAGVELDGPMEGCGDGEWKGRRYFTCLPGRAFFCPVTSLRADPSQVPYSPQHGELTDRNPLGALPDWGNENQVIAGDQILKYIGERRGIQGHQNSCYIDATLFGLFALSDVFDSLFINNLKSLTPATPIQEEIGDMLWKAIVNPLRKNGAVKFESVMRLRNKLEELGKMERVNTREYDPEEFLNILLKHALRTDPFIHIKRPFGTEPEFFVQLFVEFDKSIKVPTIGKLLAKMFREQQISFAEVPTKLLVQVPRYGKQFQTYKRVVPQIKFDPGPLMCTRSTCFNCGEAACIVCGDCRRDYNAGETVHFCVQCSATVHRNPTRAGHNPEREDWFGELELLSVLCIETSHYVCFSRDHEGRWVFFDSMADRVYDQFNIPRGVECTAQLNEWVYEGDQERLMAAGPRELPELVRRFTQDVYMCIYITSDYGMYG